METEFKRQNTKPALFKMDNQQELLYSTWNSAQCYMAAWMVGTFGGERRIHVYVCLL